MVTAAGGSAAAEDSRLRAAMDTMIDGVAVLAAVRARGRVREFVIEYVNPAACELFGVQAGDLKGQPFAGLLRGYHDSALFACHVAVVETGWPLYLRDRTVTREWTSGAVTTRTFDLKAHRFEDGLVMTLHDVTEDRRTLRALAHDRAELAAAHEALARQADELQRWNTSLSRFAEVVSHDLTEPLGAVGLYVELIASRRRDALGTEGLQLLDGVQGGLRRMNALLDDLRASVRERRDAQPHAPVDMAALAHAALEALQHRIAESAATIELGELPTVRGHEAQLSRLLQNLLANALAYAAPGRPPRVTVSAERRDTCWEFSVVDNGVGINPARARDAFEPFRRLDEGQAIEGTELGLAICQAIVEAHAGRLWISERPAVGTTVCFTLPHHPPRR